MPRVIDYNPVAAIGSLSVQSGQGEAATRQWQAQQAQRQQEIQARAQDLAAWEGSGGGGRGPMTPANGRPTGEVIDNGTGTSWDPMNGYRSMVPGQPARVRYEDPATGQAMAVTSAQQAQLKTLDGQNIDPEERQKTINQIMGLKVPDEVLYTDGKGNTYRVPASKMPGIVQGDEKIKQGQDRVDLQHDRLELSRQRLKDVTNQTAQRLQAQETTQQAKNEFTAFSKEDANSIRSADRDVNAAETELSRATAAATEAENNAHAKDSARRSAQGAGAAKSAEGDYQDAIALYNQRKAEVDRLTKNRDNKKTTASQVYEQANQHLSEWNTRHAPSVQANDLDALTNMAAAPTTAPAPVSATQALKATATAPANPSTQAAPPATSPAKGDASAVGIYNTSSEKLPAGFQVNTQKNYEGKDIATGVRTPDGKNFRFMSGADQVSFLQQAKASNPKASREQLIQIAQELAVQHGFAPAQNVDEFSAWMKANQGGR